MLPRMVSIIKYITVIMMLLIGRERAYAPPQPYAGVLHFATFKIMNSDSSSLLRSLAKYRKVLNVVNDSTERTDLIPFLPFLP